MTKKVSEMRSDNMAGTTSRCIHLPTNGPLLNFMVDTEWPIHKLSSKMDAIDDHQVVQTYFHVNETVIGLEVKFI